MDKMRIDLSEIVLPEGEFLTLEEAYRGGVGDGIMHALTPSPWIPCSERLPTEADADPKGRALFEFGGDVTHATIAFICGIGKDYPGAQWMPTGLVRPEPPEVEG